MIGRDSQRNKAASGSPANRSNPSSPNVATNPKRAVSEEQPGPALSQRISVALQPNAFEQKDYLALAAEKAAQGQPADIFSLIGEADRQGYLKKRGERYPSWKERFFVLKGSNLYYFRSAEDTTRAKGHINLTGYAVLMDDSVGKAAFRITRENEKTHHFSSDNANDLKDWVLALKKSTITRDYSGRVLFRPGSFCD